jgi:drug/metabolite transporter (DMT)-like permease
MKEPASPASPASWAVVLALTLVYVAWGTTYLAIKVGVEQFPPALFGGSRICLAGLLLLGFLAVRGQSLAISMSELFWLGLVSVFMFIGGNWLLSLAEKVMDESGEAAILAATTPVWMALLEFLWPWGDRLTWKGWLGVVLGLVGLGVMMKLPHDLTELFTKPGPLYLLASAFGWAMGSFILRHRRRGRASRLVAAGYQMVLGGGLLMLLGFGLGEWSEITLARFTLPAVGAYVYLLIFGSLVGFLAFLWLLDHVSAALAGSYSYVNPVVALLVGWALGHEIIKPEMLLGMAIILGSVFLVRSGTAKPAVRPGVGAPSGQDAGLGHPEPRPDFEVNEQFAHPERGQVGQGDRGKVAPH